MNIFDDVHNEIKRIKELSHLPDICDKDESLREDILRVAGKEALQAHDDSRLWYKTKAINAAIRAWHLAEME